MDYIGIIGKIYTIRHNVDVITTVLQLKCAYALPPLSALIQHDSSHR